MFNEQDRKNVENKLPPKGSYVKSVVKNKTIFSDGSVIISKYLTDELIDGILYDYSVKLNYNNTVITITLSFSYNDDRDSLPQIPIVINNRNEMIKNLIRNNRKGKLERLKEVSFRTYYEVIGFFSKTFQSKSS